MKKISLSLALAWIWIFSLTHSVSWGQKPPPPVPVNPQAPVLAMPMPMGVQKGTNLELFLTGTNLAGPTGIWTDFPANITIPSEDKNGQDNSKIKIRLEIPGDAPLGYHPFRLATTRGMSNLRLFCVDELPQVLEVDTNRSKTTPQPLPVPCVVAGKADTEQSDYFKISVSAGQRLSFDVLGRRLGSPIDPQITIYNPRTWRELAHNNDSPGCQSDPRLSFLFQEAGEYVIEVKDVLFRGGADYVYRLRIGDFPLATVPIPMAAKRGSKVSVHFAGPHVEGVAPVEVQVPPEPTLNVLWIAPKGPKGLHGWPVALTVSDMDEQVEQEPNNEPTKANRLEKLPAAITGRFQQADDLDCYLFSAKKGQKILIEAQTLELFSPTLVYMILKNAKTGAELAKTKPDANPPLDQRIDFTAPGDGDYLLEVQHLNYLGGPSEAYRLSLTPTTSTFDLSIGLDRYDLAPNSVAALTVQVNRKGYAGPIDLNVAGPRGITGSVKVKAGQASATLLVVAKDDVSTGPYAIQVLGQAVIDGQKVVQAASVSTPVKQSLANLPFPPPQFQEQILLAVKEKAPFALLAKWDHPEGVPGLANKLTLTVKRDPGFNEEISLNPPVGLPPNVPVPKLANIAKDKNELQVDIALNAKAPVGEYLVTFSAKTKFQNKEFVASVPLPLNLTMPFDLKVEPSLLKLTPGSKQKLKITAIRRGGYQGPITLEVRKLQTNVTAAKATIPMGKDFAEVEIISAAAAPPGDKTDVDVLGTATALNNLQNASPAFTVTIGKK